MHIKNTKPQTNFTIHNRHILFNPKYYRLFALGTFAFLLTFTLSAILTPVSDSSAATEVVVEKNNTGYYLRLSSTASALTLSPEATPYGTLASALDSVNVKTNSLSGFQLYLSTSEVNLYKDADSANAGLGYFKPVSSTIDNPTALGLDTWGFALNTSNPTNTGPNNAFLPANGFADNSNYTTPTPSTSATFAPIPDDDNPQLLTSRTSINTDVSTSTGYTTDVYYAVNASTRIPSGTYSTTITYTAISEAVSPVTATMQDFTAAQCAAIPEDTYIVLQDSRDGKDYLVSHLKDGNCWMTQNLALDPGITLTPADSNVTTTRELPASAAVDGHSTTPSQYDTPQVVTTFQSTTDAYGSFYGNYYNWNAATAGVGLQTTKGTVYESICPRGWRLPDNSAWGETDATGNKIKSYTNLVGSYTVNVDGTGEQMPINDIANAAAVVRIQQSPLYFPLAGSYGSGIDSQDTYGDYWTRTVYSDPHSRFARFLHFNNSNNHFYSHGGDSKSYAVSVRCVFGENEANYMQNFTAEMCNNLTQATNGLTEDVRRALMDSRDGKLYNVSRMADGNCWMVSNLALDGIDGSTGKGRVLTTADTNIDAAEVGEDSVTFPDTVDITSGTSVYTPPQIYTLSQNKTTTDCSRYPNTCVVSDVAYGNYYNWHAATAMQGDENTSSSTTIKSSVCPRGWRLPDNGTEEGAKTYSNLMANYTVNVDGSGTTMLTAEVANGTAVKRVQQTPLYFPLAGRYNSGATYRGVSGFYWSRTTAASANVAYLLSLSSDNNLNLQNSGYKYDGFSVRCVLGE